MWDTLESATTLMCAPAHGGRAGYARERSPVAVRLDRPPLPDPPHQGRGPADYRDGWQPPLDRSDGAPRHACLPPARSRRAAAPLVAPAPPVDALRCWGLRVPAGTAASESTDVWPAHQPVDAGVGRRGPCRPGPHAAPGQRRNHSAGPPPSRGRLATGHALAYQSRSGLYQPKNRRDQLIQRAMPQPSWALGLGDDVWWSRLAQPDPQGGTDADPTPTWPELTPPTDAPDPKALAC